MSYVALWLMLSTVLILNRLSFSQRDDDVDETLRAEEYCAENISMSESTIVLYSHISMKYSGRCVITVMARNDHYINIQTRERYAVCEVVEIYAGNAMTVDMCGGLLDKVRMDVRNSTVTIVFNLPMQRRSSSYVVIWLSEFYTAKPVTYDCSTGKENTSIQAPELCCYTGVYEGKQDDTYLMMCDTNRCIHERLICKSTTFCEDESDDGGAYCVPMWMWLLSGFAVAIALCITVVVAVIFKRYRRGESHAETDMTPEEYAQTVADSTRYMF